jgi:cutinase
MKTFPVMYAASLLTNISPARTDQASIDEGKKAFEKANSECPSAKIVAGGYSQGAAVMHNTIGLTKSLSEAIKSKIVGVALFGDTRNQQDKGHIPNFPDERSKVWCNKDDGVCGGQLVVNAGHMSYDQKYIEEAAEWLAQRVNGGGASSGGSASSGGDAKPAAPAKGMGKGAKGGAGAGAMAGDHGHGR